MLNNFASYITPSSSLLYCSAYFDKITFHDVAELGYPVIARKGSVTQWLFDYQEHNDAGATELSADEVVPHIDDLQPIIREMERAFNDGFRSVVIVCTVNGYGVTRKYHMSKVQCGARFQILFLNADLKAVKYHINKTALRVNNHTRAIQWSYQLREHVLADLKFLPAFEAAFLRLRIKSPVNSFPIASFPPWQLGCLLGEVWLEEDVLNAMAELLYF
jgi:hypothetical protein